MAEIMRSEMAQREPVCEGAGVTALDQGPLNAVTG